jgi:hypothetical protein
MAKLKITRVFMAERTGSPQEENVANKFVSLSGSGLWGLPLHPNIIPCLDAGTPEDCCAARDYRSVVKSMASGF